MRTLRLARALTVLSLAAALLAPAAVTASAAHAATGHVPLVHLHYTPNKKIRAAIHRGRIQASARGVRQYISVINRRTRQVTASGAAHHSTLSMSTIKLLIAADVYYVNGSTLHGDTARLMHAMITISDNNAATTLFNRYGGQSMLDRVIARYHLTDTRSAAHWGSSYTSAADLAKLLADVDRDRRIGPPLFKQMSQLHRWAPGPVFAGYGVGALTGWHGAKQGYGYARDGGCASTLPGTPRT